MGDVSAELDSKGKCKDANLCANKANSSSMEFVVDVP